MQIQYQKHVGYMHYATNKRVAVETLFTTKQTQGQSIDAGLMTDSLLVDVNPTLACTANLGWPVSKRCRD